jgi:hypothetical protein
MNHLVTYQARKCDAQTGAIDSTIMIIIDNRRDYAHIPIETEECNEAKKKL